MLQSSPLGSSARYSHARHPKITTTGKHDFIQSAAYSSHVSCRITILLYEKGTNVTEVLVFFRISPGSIPLIWLEVYGYNCTIDN